MGGKERVTICLPKGLIMTWLEEALREILDRLRAFDLSRSTEVNEHFGTLAPAEREDYMCRYEAFWFAVSTILDLVMAMLLAVEQLGTLDRELRESMTGSGNGKLEAMMGVPYRVAAHTRELYGEIYTLVTFLDDLGLVDRATIAAEYQELRYVWLLRNKFIVHPPAKSPLMFEVMGKQVSTSSDPKRLPDAVVGPPGFGLTFYWKFFADKAGIDLERVDTEEVREENKTAFLEHEGWKGVAQEEILLSRIKAFGLAPVDQERLATELRKLFRERIAPDVAKRVEQAVSDRVLFRRA